MAELDQEKKDYIVKLLSELQYGSVVITVHEGVITQVDRTEKNRFAPSKKAAAKIGIRATS